MDIMYRDRNSKGKVTPKYNGSSAQPFGYTGEQSDLETGFMHLRARAYDPSAGRFLQRDPVAGAAQIPSTLNYPPPSTGTPTRSTIR
jgi:RHS repeat-associated protein